LGNLAQVNSPSPVAAVPAARSSKDAVLRGRLTERRLRPWRQDYLVYRYLWPHITAAVRQARAGLGDRPSVLDLGCGNRPYADLFEGCEYLGVDYSADDCQPDVITDATRLALRAERFDLVFCTQVIEHVPDPRALVHESFRVLRPGGYLVLTGPFWWPMHEEPHDYHRFTRHGFAHMLCGAGYDEVVITPDGGDWAQFFLSVALRLGGPVLAPVRLLTNLAGAGLDRVAPSFTYPANYTILARRPASPR
jgi:SAM-dependent methyltransferase